MQEKNHLEVFSSYLLGLGKSRATCKTYKSDIRVFLNFVGKLETPKTVTKDDVEEYIQDFKIRLAISGHRHIIYGIKFWLKYMKVKYGNNTIDYFNGLPKEMNLLRPPNAQQEIDTVKPIETLTIDERERLCESAKGNLRDYAMLRLFFPSLQRGGSVLMIDLKDIDFQKKEIVIHAKGNRVYPVNINDEIVTALQEYLKIRETPKEGFVLDNWNREKYHKDALFLNGDGKRPTYNLVYHVFKRYAEKSNITKRVFPHLARHCGITYLLDMHVPLKTVAEQSGHKTLSVLMRYHHPDKEKARRECVDILTAKTETAPTPPEPPKKKPETPIDPMVSNIEQQIQLLQQQLQGMKKQNITDISIQ